MAEILFFAKNNTLPDPERDRRGCYKRGMPVNVFDDGHTWGREESKQQWISEGNLAADWSGVFVIVKIPGVPKEKIKDLTARQQVDDDGAPFVDGEGRPKRYRRRKWRILVASLPAAIRNKLVTDGEVTVTASQVRNYIKRIRDDLQYTGLD